MPSSGGGGTVTGSYISVLDKPEIFTPSGNPVIWEFKSLYAVIGGSVSSIDNPNLAYFEITVYHEGQVVAVLKAYATPDNPSGGYCNLSKILESYAGPEFVNYNNGFVDCMTRPVFSYNLAVTEMNVSSTGQIVPGASYTSTDYYVFDARLDKITFKYFKSKQYVISDGNPNLIKFLTTKQDRTVLNSYSDEGLCFLYDGYATDVYAKFSFYDRSGALIYSFAPAIVLPPALVTPNALYRINVSPGYLDENIAGLDFNDVGSFTVCLIDESEAVLSETRTFIYRELDCYLSPVNFYWWNKFGGIDSFQFFVSETNLAVNRTSILKNDLQRDSKDRLRSFNDNIFNVVEQIIDYSTTKTITVNTLDLSEAQAKWLSSILLSKNIWMRGDSDLIIPVTCRNPDYSMVPKRTIQGLNIKEFQFVLSDGFDADYRIEQIITVPAVISGIAGEFYNY